MNLNLYRICRLHKAGISVLLDVVFNHTGEDVKNAVYSIYI